ncbi:MAG: NADH-quinone oxidoreductase subunit NuoF [Anaerolineae bacterium]|nr:NADH-quinone oxidoreductase subunit NuoF [Anaerolineae bacterium]
MVNKLLAQHVLLRHRDVANIHQIDTYLAHGGYQALKHALAAMLPEAVINEVRTAGLRGRGGAGFPAGVKWGFIPKDVFPKYVVVNADESEPGTFKDREIMEANPHQLLEGIALCAYAVGAETAYIYGRGEFKTLFTTTLRQAVDEAYAQGFLGRNILGSNFSLNLYLHLGAGAYICGEETALLNSLEGVLGQPRSRPPFPAVAGLYAKPTVINNVETLANVPPIIANGADWYRQFGPEKSPGTKIFCLSGRVNRPGNYELPLGTPIRYLIEECGGGVIEGKAVKGILPAGASSAIMGADKLDTPMDYESMAAAGSMLGSASFIILDETVNAVWAAEKNIKFFKHESCGKCSPCREGTHWLAAVYRKLREGDGTKQDIALLETIISQMEGNCFCLLGEFVVPGVRTSLELFADEYEALAREKVETGKTAPDLMHVCMCIEDNGDDSDFVIQFDRGIFLCLNR